MKKYTVKFVICSDNYDGGCSKAIEKTIVVENNFIMNKKRLEARMESKLGYPVNIIRIIPFSRNNRLERSNNFGRNVLKNNYDAMTGDLDGNSYYDDDNQIENQIKSVTGKPYHHNRYDETNYDGEDEDNYTLPEDDPNSLYDSARKIRSIKIEDFDVADVSLSNNKIKKNLKDSKSKVTKARNYTRFEGKTEDVISDIAKATGSSEKKVIEYLVSKL